MAAMNRGKNVPSGRGTVEQEAVPPRWTSLSQTSKHLLAAGTLLMAVLIAAVGLMVWQLHTDALTDARQNVGKLGIAVSEQASRSIQAADLVLEDLRKQFAAKGLASVAAFKDGLADESLHRFLLDRSNALRQVNAFTVIAADGKLVNYSRGWPVPPTDLADRDYVAYFRGHNVPGAFVSKPVQNRGDGGWTVYLVRRVNSPSGEFIGMVLAAIDLKYFQEFFKALTVGAGTTVTLLNNDGTALTSYPATAKIGEMLPAISPWHEIIKSGPGVFTTQGVLAPGMRIVSVHPLGDYPFVINVSVAERDALATWMRMGVVAGACTALAVLGVAVLLRALVLQFRRLESSETLLEDRNGRLQVTQRRLEAQAAELSASQAQLRSSRPRFRRLWAT